MTLELMTIQPVSFDNNPGSIVFRTDQPILLF